MKNFELERKLIAAARRQTPDDRVPYAFEKRVMALIAARKTEDSWVFSLWRSAVTCAAVAAVFVAVSLFPPVADNHSDLSQDLENTLLASIDQGDLTP